MCLHSFRADIAQHFGVNTAILIQNIKFWVEKNQANRKHFHDGKYWTYNSLEAFAELFPYLTKNQIQRCLLQMVKEGLLLKGNYNKNSYDRTSWYTLTDYAYDLFFLGFIDDANLHDGRCQNQSPIPYSKTDSKTDKEKTTKKEVLEQDMFNGEVKTITDNNSTKQTKPNYNDFIDSWNKHLGSKTAKVTKLSIKRRKAIDARIKEGYSSDDFDKACQLFSQLDYMFTKREKEYKNWSPTFDWLIVNTKDWITQLLEGQKHTEPKLKAMYDKVMNNIVEESESIDDVYTDETRPDYYSDHRGVWSKAKKEWIR